MFIKKFEELINAIEIEHGVTQQIISKAIGRRNKAYLTEMMSSKRKELKEGKSGEIADSIVLLIKKAFPIPKNSYVFQDTINILQEPEFETNRDKINRYLAEIDVLLQKIKILNGHPKNNGDNYTTQEIKKKKRS